METFMTVPQLSKTLGISRKAAYQLVARKRVPVVHIGRRVLIPAGRLEAELLGRIQNPEE